MAIDWGQVLPWLLGIIGIVIGGWKTTVAAKAEADKKTAEANAAKITADADTQTVVNDTLRRQQTLLEEIHKSQKKRDFLARKDRLRHNTNIEGQLSRISGLFSDIRNGEGNIHTALTQLITSQQQLVTSVNAIPQAVQNAIVEANRNEIRNLGKLLRGEMAQSQFEREGYRFPAAEDPDWREEMIYPLEPEVAMHKGPYYDSDVQLRKPCAIIQAEGERVRLIANRYTEFIIVDKLADGERCWGYVPRNKVRIGVEAPPPP